MDIRIQKAKFEDVLPFWQQQLWSERTTPIEAMSAIDPDGKIDPSFQSRKECAFFWQAVDSNNRVVGVVGAQTMGGTYRSRGLWVDPTVRSQGIGRKLVGAVVTAARAQNKTSIWTMPRASSVDFYKKIGFKIKKTVDGYEYGPHFIADLEIEPVEKSPETVNAARLQLYSQLFLYGDFMPMHFWFNPDQVANELEAFNKDWVPYNIQRGDTGREGLSVTSLDGGMSGYPDLQSLYQYSNETGHVVSENDFNKLTAVYDKVPSIRPVLDYYKDILGRSRFVRFRPGGHFPPHRDQSVSYQVPDYYRIFVPLANTGENRLFFTYDGKLMSYEPGRCYLFNALKVHSVFSFAPGALTLALSVRLTQDSVARGIRALLVK